MFWSKLKGGALQLTLFIIVVIALLLTAFVLLIHTHKRFSVQTDFIIETVQNANKGIDYVLSNPNNSKDTINVALDDLEHAQLKVQTGFWGIFEKVTSEARIKTYARKKMALIGASQSETPRTVLYVQDNNRPLVLVGDTKIEGQAFLPELGVKPGAISGRSYYGSQLIYGPVKTASQLPEVSTRIKAGINKLSQEIYGIEQDQFLRLVSGQRYVNSFFEPLKMVYSNGLIRLEHVSLTGHIMVQSNTKVIVSASSTLKDILIVAPEIVIEDHVKGNFQAIATKQITVEKNVMLQYPSALVVQEKEEEINTPQSGIQNKISINDGSQIKGVVLYHGQPKTDNFNPQIVLSEKALIIGEVYCNQNLELKGTIHGSVYTSNFVTRAFGSIYQNHIYNGTITVNDLAEEYVGLTFKNSKKEVVKWLY